MRIRQRKRARTSAVFASATTSKPLSSRFSQLPGSEGHPVTERPKNLPAQLQRAIQLGPDLAKLSPGAI